MHVARVSLKNKALNRIPPSHYRRGRLLRLPIHSRWLYNGRNLDIYLPPSYDHDPQRRFPVLYMHDGNNLYYPEMAFGGMPWHVDHMLDRLISHGLSEEVGELFKAIRRTEKLFEQAEANGRNVAEEAADIIERHVMENSEDII